MRIQNRIYHVPANLSFDEIVPIDPQLTREAQFEQWLNELSVCGCKFHPSLPSVVHTTLSMQRWLSQSPTQNWDNMRGRPDLPHPEDRRKFHPFQAVLQCDACFQNYAGVPEDFQTANLDNYPTGTPELASALALAREAVELSHGFVVFCGMPGTGKTRLACSMLGRRSHYSNLYLTQSMASLLHGVTASQRHHVLRRDSDERDQNDEILALRPSVWTAAADARILVLDELGGTVLTREEQIHFDNLMRVRYEKRRFTILVSNLPPTGSGGELGLKEFLGAALVDRIFHASGKGRFIVQFAGPSLRRNEDNDYFAP